MYSVDYLYIVRNFCKSYLFCLHVINRQFAGSRSKEYLPFHLFNMIERKVAVSFLLADYRYSLISQYPFISFRILINTEDLISF